MQQPVLQDSCLSQQRTTLVFSLFSEKLPFPKLRVQRGRIVTATRFYTLDMAKALNSIVQCANALLWKASTTLDKSSGESEFSEKEQNNDVPYCTVCTTKIIKSLD